MKSEHKARRGKKKFTSHRPSDYLQSWDNTENLEFSKAEDKENVELILSFSPGRRFLWILSENFPFRRLQATQFPRKI